MRPFVCHECSPGKLRLQAQLQPVLQTRRDGYGAVSTDSHAFDSGQAFMQRHPIFRPHEETGTLT